MYRSFKEILDRIVSLFLLIILSPILLHTALLLWLSNRGKIFFVQARPGLKGKIFHIIKFKTMNDAVDEHGKLRSDEERLTRIGKIIRRLSIDELPQLLNVVMGDMSLIGPRPLLPEYLSLYNDFQRRRHEVKPGLTGWAQVNGRNAISWQERFALDVYYVDNMSLLLDVKIVFLTLKRLFRPEGISSRGHATMEAFRGN